MASVRLAPEETLEPLRGADTCPSKVCPVAIRFADRCRRYPFLLEAPYDSVSLVFFDLAPRIATDDPCRYRMSSPAAAPPALLLGFALRAEAL